MPAKSWLLRPARRSSTLWLTTAAALVSSGCSIVVDADREQCATNDDCRRRGAAFAGSVCSHSVCVTEPTWGCVGKVPTWPAPAPGRVTATLHLTDLITNAPVANVIANVCAKKDPSCGQPLAAGLRGDDAGTLVLDLEKSFDGFLELEAMGMVPTMYFFYPPVEKDRDIPYTPLVPFTALEVFGEQLKMQPLLDRGTVIALSYDCQSKPAAGLRLSVDVFDDSTQPFYMQKGLPSLTANETDESGQAGIGNVIPGIRQVSAQLASTGLSIGTVSVVVRPIEITYTTMLPTPTPN